MKIIKKWTGNPYNTPSFFFFLSWLDKSDAIFICKIIAIDEYGLRIDGGVCIYILKDLMTCCQPGIHTTVQGLLLSSIIPL